MMVAPVTRAWLKPISMYFPKRLLLSFLVVFAFPKAWQEASGGLRPPGALETFSPLHPPTLLEGISGMQGHEEHRESLGGRDPPP